MRYDATSREIPLRLHKTHGGQYHEFHLHIRVNFVPWDKTEQHITMCHRWIYIRGIHIACTIGHKQMDCVASGGDPADDRRASFIVRPCWAAFSTLSHTHAGTADGCPSASIYIYKCNIRFIQESSFNSWPIAYRTSKIAWLQQFSFWIYGMAQSRTKRERNRNYLANQNGVSFEGDDEKIGTRTQKEEETIK